MARTVFFSFHYQRDIWRVNQVRNIPNITGVAAAGFKDASLWEEAKKKGVQRVILKDHDNIEDFADKVVEEIKKMIL